MYVPLNLNVYTAAFAGAIAGIGVPSGAFITDPVTGDYVTIAAVAAAYAQAVDTAWGAGVANVYDVEAITDGSTNIFTRGPGHPLTGAVTTQANWTIVAMALVALVRQGDTNATTIQLITFPSIPVGGGLISVPNEAALVAIQVGTIATPATFIPDGFDVYVETYRCKWRLRTSAVAPVANEIATSTTQLTRQWYRLDYGGAPDANPWLNQLGWSISPIGNNEAVGTPAAPLLTFTEFERRLRGARLNAVFTIQALGALAAIRADVDLGPLGMLVIDGNLGAIAHPGVPPAPWPAGVQLAAAAAYTPANVAGQQFAIVDVVLPALFDWTPYVGARVRCSPNAFPHAAGPFDRCTFIVESVNPAGGGNNTARVTIPNGCDVYDPLGPNMTGLVPLNNDFLYAELLPDSGTIVLDIIKQAGATLPSVNITGFNVSDPAVVAVALEVRAQVPTALANPFFGRPLFFGCTMNVMQSYEPLLFWECGFVNPGGECQISGKNAHEMTQFFNCGFLNMNVSIWNCSYTANLWQGSRLGLQPGFHDFPVYNGFFDQVGDNQIVVNVPGVSVGAAGALFGIGANRGLYVMTNGFHMSYVIAPTLNVGGVSEFRVMGAEFVWAAALPFPALASVDDVSIQPLTV